MTPQEQQALSDLLHAIDTQCGNGMIPWAIEDAYAAYQSALSAAKAVDHMPDAGKMVQPQAQGEANNFPFYELKFIMRVLGHKGDAPKADWDTAYGMAREIFTRWHTATINPQAQGEAVDYDYQATFNAIAEAAKPSANGLAISVKKFWESYRASTHPQASEPAWMPIATAPKDGTPILLFGDNRVTSGHWSAPSEIPHIVYQDGFAPEPEWDEWEPYWASWDGGFTEDHPATHWKPLPAAPEATK